MILHMDYRYEVKSPGNEHALNLPSLGYGSNFTVSIIVIIIYAITAACSITLLFPDQQRMAKGQRARASMTTAIRKSRSLQPPNRNRAIAGQAQGGGRRSQAGRNSRRSSRTPQVRRSRM